MIYFGRPADDPDCDDEPHVWRATDDPDYNEAERQAQEAEEE